MSTVWILLDRDTSKVWGVFESEGAAEVHRDLMSRNWTDAGRMGLQIGEYIVRRSAAGNSLPVAVDEAEATAPAPIIDADGFPYATTLLDPEV